MPESSALAANRDFKWFWYGQAISSLGDGFAMVALPLLVLEASNSVTQMGVVTALAAAGQIVMSLFSGLILDRVNRRRLMIATDLGRMIVYAALPIAWLFTQQLVLIYVVAFGAAAMGNLFSVGQVAGVANLVPRAQLADANSRLQATTALAFTIGPLVAGVVCARFGTAVALWVDAATFAASAGSLAIVRFGAEARPVKKPNAGMFHELSAGLRFVLRDRVLRGTQLFMIGVGLLASAGVGAAVIDLFVFHLRTELQQSSTVVGACLGISAIGALTGAIVSPRVRRRWGLAACMFGGTCLQAVGMLVGGLVSAVAATIVAGGLWSLGLTLRAVAGMSIRQERAPDAILGRIVATMWTTSFTASCIGAVVVTHLAASVGAMHALDMVGVALAVVALVGAASRFTAGVGVSSAATDR